MQQFNLEEWLQDKSRKVVTRLNKQVQIISTEGRDDIPIIALVEGIAHQYKSNGFHADVIVAYSNQCRDMGDYDLFFADEEGLTKFDYAVLSIISDHNSHTDSIEAFAKRSSKKLLDLTRKELLKDLPKWKKITEEKQNYLAYGYLSHDEYYLSIKELKDKLPKEE